MANVNFASTKVDRSNKPILVAADIEHNPSADLIGRWEGGAQLVEVAIVGMPHYFEPAG